MNRTTISTGGPYEATNGYSRCVKIEHDAHTDFFFAGTTAMNPDGSIECEDEDEPIEDFYFAKAMSITETHVRLRCVDGLGQWEEPDPVPLDDMTMVQMGTPYLTRFARYVR